MNSALSGIPINRRRRVSATLGLFAVLFVTVGIVATTGTTPAVVRVFSAVSLAVAALLALISWGVAHSIKIDLAERRLDDAIEATVAERGGTDVTCGCGHDHDVTEMNVTGQASDSRCAHDGLGPDSGTATGSDCARTCETCVLAALRPSPDATRAERLRGFAQ